MLVNGELAFEVFGSEGVGFHHFCRRSLEHDFAAFASCAGTDVYDVVGCQHHVLVVFYYDDGVANVAQVLERVYQSFVVALMQSDAGLVEDVEHVDQLRTYLSGESYSLALAA